MSQSVQIGTIPAKILLLFINKTPKLKKMSTENNEMDTLQIKDPIEKQIVIIKKIDKGDKFIPADYVKQLYTTIDNVRDKTYIMYHIETGLRASDVVNTELIHVSLQELRTYTYDEKKDKWRWVYFPESVKSQIKMWLKQRQIENIKDKRLFPFSKKTANRIIKHWCKRIGFPFAKEVGTHWCRHTFIRLSRKAGRDIKLVQQNTGDSIKTLLEWYSDLSGEDIKDEMKAKPLVNL